jgi:hypothetical protein
MRRFLPLSGKERQDLPPRGKDWQEHPTTSRPRVEICHPLTTDAAQGTVGLIQRRGVR